MYGDKKNDERKASLIVLCIYVCHGNKFCLKCSEYSIRNMVHGDGLFYIRFLFLISDVRKCLMKMLIRKPDVSNSLLVLAD